jgi:hypothetical protein
MKQLFAFAVDSIVAKAKKGEKRIANLNKLTADFYY